MFQTTNQPIISWFHPDFAGSIQQVPTVFPHLPFPFSPSNRRDGGRLWSRSRCERPWAQIETPISWDVLGYNHCNHTSL